MMSTMNFLCGYAPYLGTALMLAAALCGCGGGGGGGDAGDGRRDSGTDASVEDAGLDGFEDDGLAPDIEGVFPPSFAGIEGPTTVRVETSDAFGIASVRVGSITATPDAYGMWSAVGVPPGTHTITVVDGTGRETTLDHTLTASHAFSRGLTRLAAEASGTVVGFDADRGELMRFDYDALPRFSVVSGRRRGSGPPLFLRQEREPKSIDVVAGVAHVLVRDFVNERVELIAVDLATGDRTLALDCDVAGAATAVTVGAPLRVYVLTYADQVFRCDASAADDVPVLLGAVPFAEQEHEPAAVRHDAAEDRLVIAEGYYGEILAFDLTDGQTSVLVPSSPAMYDQGVYGLALFGGDTYYLTRGGALRRVLEGQEPETLYADTSIQSSFSGMAACGSGATAFCFGKPTMARVREMDGTWSASVPDDTSPIGSGPGSIWAGGIAVRSTSSSWLTKDLLVQGGAGQQFRVDMRTGVRTIEGGVSMVPVPFSDPLDSGTSAAVGNDNLIRVASVSATPITAMTVPGGDVGLYAVPPALVRYGTRLSSEEAAVYVRHDARTTLRMRGLHSGVDTVLATAPADVTTLAAGSDGAVYMAAGASGVYVLRPFASTPELLASPSFIQSLAMDDGTRTLYALRNVIHAIDVDTGNVERIDPTDLEPPVGDVRTLRRGPFPRTLLASAFGYRSVILIDLETRTSYALARD